MNISSLFFTMKKLTRKGQIGGPLAGVIGIVFALFFIGILVYAFALAGAEMAAATDDVVAEEIINETLAGAQAFAQFSPTLWIMAAIAALITILIGAVGVFFLARART